MVKNRGMFLVFWGLKDYQKKKKRCLMGICSTSQACLWRAARWVSYDDYGKKKKKGDLEKREAIKVSPESSTEGCEGNMRDKDNLKNREDSGRGHSPVVLLVFTQIMNDPRKSMNTFCIWMRYHPKIWFQTMLLLCKTQTLF